MTHQEILTKAVKKAIEGGWLPIGRDPEHPELISSLSMEGVDKCYIFNHDFARALWGEGERDEDGYLGKTLWAPRGYKTGDSFVPAYWDGPVWQYHLQQMVIADDPIKYLSDTI